MKLTKELFEDVIAYIFSEPGAMGCAGNIECLKATGEVFNVDYLDEETNWELVKENFEGIRGCKFNGPNKNVMYSNSCLCLGGRGNIVTTIKEGWKEICFDVGNHFVCREEIAPVLIDYFKGMEPYKIICEGMDKIKKDDLCLSLVAIMNQRKEYKEKLEKN